MNEITERGLALLCDEAGAILQVLRDDLGLTAAVPARLFLRLVDGDSRVKALNFLAKTRETGAAFDWELNVMVADGLTSLHFSGGQIDEHHLLIVAATNDELARQLYEDMLRMSNEQVNRLRAALKARLDHNTELYDEISRLNNELVTMQRELAKKNAELERLNQEKNRFLGMAAHELRNPLHIIQTYSELLSENRAALSAEEQHEFLTNIFNLSQYMARLIDDLLSVSVIEAGQLNLELQRVDLVALVRQNVARNRLLAARKQMDIVVESEPLPPFLLDVAKIEQVLDNLINNAIKFSPPGTRIWVRLRGQENGALLAVQDQGPGIPPQEIEKLFKPFGRLGARTTGGERSTGLGLVIVKRIVEGHHGTIWPESQVGQGTTFFVSLPRSTPEMSQ